MATVKPTHILNNRQLLALLIKRANDYFSFPHSVDLYHFEIFEKTYTKQMGDRLLYYMQVNIKRNKILIYAYEYVANDPIDNYATDIVYDQIIIAVLSGGLMIKESSAYYHEPINLP